LNFAAPKQPAPLHRRELEEPDVWITGHRLDPCFQVL
jgi:hypothetical protein